MGLVFFLHLSLCFLEVFGQIQAMWYPSQINSNRVPGILMLRETINSCINAIKKKIETIKTILTSTTTSSSSNNSNKNNTNNTTSNNSNNNNYHNHNNHNTKMVISGPCCSVASLESFGFHTFIEVFGLFLVWGGFYLSSFFKFIFCFPLH